MVANTPSVDEILAAIRESGGRVTSTKRALVEVLVASNEHMTAEDITTAIQHAAPDTGPSTIYRNLEDLEHLGIVVHAHLGRAAAVYHLAGAIHGHLLCSNCARTIKVPSSLFENLARAAKRDHDFEVDRHHLAISGLCDQCQER